MDVLLDMLFTMWAAPAMLWLLLVAPGIVLVFVYAQWRRGKSLARLGNVDLLRSLSANVSTPMRWVRSLMVAAAVSWAVLAAARPQWGTITQLVETAGVDIVILLDTSLSMLAEDVGPNRLAAAKQEVSTFLAGLTGDRVALVPFAGTAFVQCPLTADYSALQLFLREISTGTVQDEGTDLAHAMRVGLNAFAGAEDGRSRVMILLTDGEAHESDPVMQAAERMREEGVVAYAIGIGSSSGELIPMRRGGSTEFLRDQDGRVVKTRLDEATLQRVAVETDGTYFRASPGAMELQEVFDDIEELEQSRRSEEQLVSRVDRYQWPLGIAVVLLLIVPFVPDRRRRVPS